jgi:integrase
MKATIKTNFPKASDKIDLNILQQHLETLDLTNADNLNFWLYCTIAMRTGLRSIDILKMKTSSINKKERFSELVEQKTKKKVRVRIVNVVIDKINFEQDYVIFNHKYKTNVSLMTINRRLKALYTDSNSNVSSHSIRKSTATSIYEKTGNNIIKAMLFLNHSSPLMTKNYLGITASEKMELYDLLDY